MDRLVRVSLVFLCALAPSRAALAQVPADAPLAAAAPAPTPPELSAGVTLAASERPSLLLHLGAGIGAGMLSVPVGLGVASWVGQLSNSLVWAALPWLLSVG